MNDLEETDRASLLSNRSISPSSDALSKLIKRLRALTLKLLPVEVDPEKINEPTSRIITQQVISAYKAAAGDYLEALPYCLLCARRSFIWDANHNPADYGENYGRAIACEVLARRVIHQAPKERLNSIMSSRFRHQEWDGDDSDLSSALELAIDQHCIIFLSSSEAQDVVEALWRGDIIQKNNKHHDIDYVPYKNEKRGELWTYLDPSRLSVPRYQNVFRLAIWMFFLLTYSQAVRQPLEKLDARHSFLDGWEIILYILALSFTIEDVYKFTRTLLYFNWRAFTFWNIISLVTDALLLSAFILRIIGLNTSDDDTGNLHYRSFQVLSFVAPFIWMKLITVLDGYKYIGTMQICVAHMMQESGIFFALLSVLGVGFAQGLYAIDAADGRADRPMTIINSLIQALLQSPDFEKAAASGVGLTLFYFWNVATTVILLNVLISLFSSAYDDVVSNAEAHFLAFFAGKTVSMIRAPDSYVYPAPFNIFETILVAPWEHVLSEKTFAKLNRYVMRTIFFLPLMGIALFEAYLDTSTNAYMKAWFTASEEGEEDIPTNQDPEVEDESGLKISKVPFKELIRVFPNAEQSAEAAILAEMTVLKEKIDDLARRMTS